MALISNTFNSVSEFFGGMFRRTLNIVNRGRWKSYFVDRKAPQLVDTENLIEVYQCCPHLQIVINKKAEMFSNGIFRIRDKKTKEDKPDHWAIKLMKNPNPMQPQKEFLYEYSILNDVYANSFVYRLLTMSRKVAVMHNLPPSLIKITPTGKWLKQTDIKEIVQEYVMMGTPIQKFTTDEVKHLNSGVSKSFLISDSKILALQLPISNIVGALKTRNLFIYYGPKQLVTSKGSDGEGALPLDPDEQAILQERLNKTDYGLGDKQSHTIVTTATLTVEKMSYPTKDMMLFEEIEDDFQAICGQYGMDRDLFPSTKGATFENKKQGEQTTYQTTIQTAAASACNFFDTLLNLEEEGVESYLDYSHLAVMQEDDQKKATATKTRAEMLGVLVTANIMSPKQAQQFVEQLTGIKMDEKLGNSNAILDMLTEMSPLLANNLSQYLTLNSILEMFKQPKVEGGDIPIAMMKAQMAKDNAGQNQN